MLATTLAFLAAPAFAADKSPQTQYNTPDPGQSAMPGNMNAGQGAAPRDPNLATAPDTRPDSPNGQHLTTKPGAGMSNHRTVVPDRRSDSPNGQRLNQKRNDEEPSQGMGE